MENIRGNKEPNFEGMWSDAFEGKEMKPSPELWQKLDNHLANQESKKYRKGIFFYKWVAAASVVLLLVASGLYIATYQQASDVVAGGDTAAIPATEQPNAAKNESTNELLDRQSSVFSTNESAVLAEGQGAENELRESLASNDEENSPNEIAAATGGVNDKVNAKSSLQNEVGDKDVIPNTTDTEQTMAINNESTQELLDSQSPEFTSKDSPVLTEDKIVKNELRESLTGRGEVNKTNEIAVTNSGLNDKVNPNSSLQNDVGGNNGDKVSNTGDKGGIPIFADKQNMAVIKDESVKKSPSSVGDGKAGTGKSGSNGLVVDNLATNGTNLIWMDKPEIDRPIDKVILFGDDPFKKDNQWDDGDNLWAGINMSSGIFDSNFGGNENLDLSQAAPGNFNSDAERDDQILNLGNASVVERDANGQVFSFGFNVGKKVAKKWVLQSGLNYQNYVSSGSSNAFLETNNGADRSVAAYSSQLKEDANLSIASSQVNFDNRLDYLSIPFKAGFLVADKKFGMMISAGVATDFLVRNKLVSNTNGVESAVLGPGEDVPYRSVYINGLIGTQFRYRFSDHYSFSVEPSYSLALNSLTKSNSGPTSFPYVFRMGVGIKYIFK